MLYLLGALCLCLIRVQGGGLPSLKDMGTGDRTIEIPADVEDVDEYLKQLDEGLDLEDHTYFEDDMQVEPYDELEVEEGAGHSRWQEIIASAHQMMNEFGEPEKLMDLLQEAKQINPESSLLQSHLGVQYGQRGEIKEAIAAFTASARIAKAKNKVKQAAAAYYNMGMAILTNTGDLLQAQSAFLQATQIRQGFYSAYLKLAQCARDLGDLPNAIKHLEEAARLRPDDGYVRTYLADSYNNLKQFAKASEFYKAAIELMPGNPEPVVGLADTLANQKKYDEAHEQLSTLAKQTPNPAVLRALLRTKRTMSKWGKDWTALINSVIKATEEETLRRRFPAPSSLQPYQTLYLPTRPAFQQMVAESHTANIPPVAPDAMNAWLKRLVRKDVEADPEDGNFEDTIDTFDPFQHRDKLKIGYLSRRFETYAGTQLMLRVFGHHDREKFEIFAYSYGPPNESEEREIIERDADHFQDVSGLSFSELALAIAEDQIDILVDYDGHHSFNSLPVLNARPAPIVATWLGFAGTTGLGALDYIIADDFVIKPRESKFFSEKPVFLPDTYQPQDDQQKMAQDVPSRADVGLPEEGFVYACFNRNDKIEPDVFAAWMEILKQVDNSVLWLYNDAEDGPAAVNLKAEAVAAGVDAERIIFAPRLPKDQHLSRHLVADLFLDTFYYGAHTTAADALYSGLPVLTAPGATFASRVAGSLLRVKGFDELIVKNHEEYIKKAVELGQNPAKNQEFKDKLLTRRDSALFDSKYFTRQLESAYTAMWDDKTEVCEGKQGSKRDFMTCWVLPVTATEGNSRAYLRAERAVVTDDQYDADQEGSTEGEGEGSSTEEGHDEL